YVVSAKIPQLLFTLFVSHQTKNWNPIRQGNPQHRNPRGRSACRDQDTFVAFTGGLSPKCIGSYGIYQRSGIVLRIKLVWQKDTVQSVKLRVFAPGANEILTLLQGPIDCHLFPNVAGDTPSPAETTLPAPETPHTS